MISLIASSTTDPMLKINHINSSKPVTNEISDI